MRALTSITKALRNLAKDTRGNLAIAAGLAMPALLVAGGSAVDYGAMLRLQSQLQVVADAAAIGAARELALATAEQDYITEVAKELVENNLSGDIAISNIKIDTQLVESGAGVQVNVSYSWTPFFAHLFSNKVTPVTSQATANMLGSGLICVVGLMERNNRAGIHLDDNSRLRADDCGVYSNSRSRVSIRADDNASITAATICAAGGYREYGSADFSPIPTTDCPQIPDPLIDRAAPPVGACDETGLVIEDDMTLKPGVYCNGLTIDDEANVTLEAGIYVIKDGPFTVADEASLSGVDAGFFLTGNNSTINFEEDTTISLEAPRSGPLAGLLFYEDRNVPYSLIFDPFKLEEIPANVRVHRISSNDARQLLGTIYMPKSILLVDAEAPVADQSAYTAIVVARLWLQEGPILYLNANYPATEVPVPKALIGSQIVLAD